MALRLNMNDLNPGIFFLWPTSEKKEQGGITVRALTNQKRDEFLTATTTEEEDYRDGRVYVRKDEDKDTFNELTYDYCIVDWTELYDNDKPIPCNKKNKLKLMKEHPVFPGLVNTAIAIAGSERAMREEKELKNFFRS